ncbi:MAG: cupredoxin domain-containing protein [Actinomycetota bacterium]|nr:cupredoxin domain-containing protein [Actinomycetota bacterium]
MRAWLASIARGRRSKRPVAVAARQVRVSVAGGYHPDTVRADAGRPLRILFHREESSTCSEQVVFPAFGKSATLPQGEDVAVDLVPVEPGSYEFTCALGMLRGRLVVSPAGDTTTGLRQAVSRPEVTTTSTRRPS